MYSLITYMLPLACLKGVKDKDKWWEATFYL